MIDTSPLPFSPLTHNELNRRTQDQTLLLGHRVRAIVNMGDGIQDHDQRFFTLHAGAAAAYSRAARQRAGLEVPPAPDLVT